MAEITRPFARAVQALIEAAVPGRDVYYGRPTKPDADLTYPYVIVWVIPANRVRANLTGTIAAPDSRVQLTAVGRDQDEVAWTLDACADALQGQRPALDGWRSGLIWEMPVQQAITKNEDLLTPQGTPTYRGVSMWRLSSEPVPAAGS